jgi:hypothetical protein
MKKDSISAKCTRWLRAKDSSVPTTDKRNGHKNR